MQMNKVPKLQNGILKACAGHLKTWLVEELQNLCRYQGTTFDIVDKLSALAAQTQKD